MSEETETPGDEATPKGALRRPGRRYAAELRRAGVEAVGQSVRITKGRHAGKTLSIKDINWAEGEISCTLPTGVVRWFSAPYFEVIDER